MPRLLILCEYGTLNGGERSMLATLPGVVQAGYDVRVLMPPGPSPLADTLQGFGVEVVPYKQYQGNRPQLSLDEQREWLAEILREYRPALLHANSLSMGRLAGPVAAELGVPSISHIRDIIALNRQNVADLNYNTRLLAVSGATRQFHVSQGVDGAKVHVLHNGVDIVQFCPNQPTGYLHDELGLPRKCLLLGTYQDRFR